MVRPKIFLVLLASVVLFSVCGFAQTDKETIEAQLNKSFEAFAKQDWETAASLFTSDWVIVIHTGASFDMEGFKKFFADHITEHTIALSNVQVHVSGDATMAWTTFNEETSYKFDGNPVSENAVFTAIFVKEGDAWKMKMEQRTIVQPPPPMTDKK